MFGENSSNTVVDGALGFTPPDYGIDAVSGYYPDTAKRRATFFRDGKTKRPINTRNIQHNTSSNLVGNYNNKYEIILLHGRKENNLYYRDASDISVYLPPQYTSSLPHTTHVMGLFGIDPGIAGNVFGKQANNRQPDGLEIIPVVSGIGASGSFSVTASAAASDGDAIQIGGITFELDTNSSVTDSSTLKGIDCGGSVTNDTFFNALTQSIVDSLSHFRDGSVTYAFDASTSKAVFTLNSNTTGSALNFAITSAGSSFTSVSGMSGGTDEVPAVTGSDVTLKVSRSTLRDSSRNRSVIAGKFSAPGGPEIQSNAFLDVYAREYSVYNALPFRNLSVKGNKIRFESGLGLIGGSGEQGTIRVEDHLGQRRGFEHTFNFTLRTIWNRFRVRSDFRN